MPQRTVPIRPAPQADLLPPAVDRRAVRVATGKRRRAEAAERRRAATRRRRLPLLVGAAIVGVLVGGPAVLALSPLLAVDTVTVPGASPSTSIAVRQALRAELGRPLATVADRDVAAALRGVPVVESFSVVRRPPSTLEVRVVERTAVAQQAVPAGWQRVDAARVGLAVTPARDPVLPVVAASGAAAFRSSVAAIAALSRVGIAPSRVRAASEDDVVVVVGSHRVRWGGAEAGAEKAEALKAALVKAAAGATMIDVSSPGVVQTR